MCEEKNCDYSPNMRKETVRIHGTHRKKVQNTNSLAISKPKSNYFRGV
jgi:hypothetical protein